MCYLTNVCYDWKLLSNDVELRTYLFIPEKQRVEDPPLVLQNNWRRCIAEGSLEVLLWLSSRDLYNCLVPLASLVWFILVGDQ